MSFGLTSAVVWQRLRAVYGSLRERGLEVTFRYLVVRILDLVDGIRFDLRHGVHTVGLAPAADESRGFFYRSSPVRLLKRSIESTSIHYKHFVFIDLGSGKGRALFLAAAFPFKRILGVELSKKLHEVATRNIAAYKPRTASSAEIHSICSDAATYDFPQEPLVIYMFNPFPENVFSDILANLKISWERNPRSIFVIYVKPFLSLLLDRCGFLERDHTVFVPFLKRNIKTYSAIVYRSRTSLEVRSEA